MAMGYHNQSIDNHDMDDNIISRSSAAIIPLEELVAQYSEDDYLLHNRSIPILRSSIGIVSVICSMAVIFLICRSSQGLTKSTQNRLIFGLCVSDILYSITTSLFNVMAPNENYYYQYTWNAHGDALSCDIQGFLCTVGFSTGALYTCSLSLYYLAIVKYQKSDEYIRKKLEVYFHAIPIAFSVLGSIILLVNHNMNVDPTGLCWLPVHDPPHCIGFEDGTIRDGFTIPCGRGRDTKLIYILLFAISALSPPIIITISLLRIYKAVVEIEARLSNYGAASLRIPKMSVVRTASAATTTTITTTEEKNSTEKIDPATSNKGNSGFWTRILQSDNCFMKHLVTNATILRCKNDSSSSSAKKPSSSSKSRTVMYKAIAYSISYVLTWVFATIVFFLNVMEKDIPMILTYFLAIFSCLQGFYTLIIYMYPKVLVIRKKEKVSWLQVIIIAFRSRRGQQPTSRNKISSVDTSYYNNNNMTTLSQQKISCNCEVDEEEDELQLIEEQRSSDFDSTEGTMRDFEEQSVEEKLEDALHLIEEQPLTSPDIDIARYTATEEQFRIVIEEAPIEEEAMNNATTTIPNDLIQNEPERSI